MSLDRYTNMFSKLLPRGFAWRSVRLHPLIKGLSGEWFRLSQTIEEFLRDIFPQDTINYIDEWEALLGLPDECTPADQTDDERRLRITQKLAMQGNLSAGFYEEIATYYGFDVKVENHLAFQCGRSFAGDDLTNYEPPRHVFYAGDGVCGEQLKTPSWLFYFNVELPLTANDPFKVGENVAGDVLVEYGNELLECIYKRIKPAHAGVTFTFRED
jgi:uncharacterized protein YmfQ (DUF2313 family)